MTRRRGYSFVELLLVLTFIGLLARLGIPRYRDMKVRAAAAAIVSDVHTIQLAGLTYFTERQAWPADAAEGLVPPGLVSHLPTNFSFTRPDHTYDYEVWPLSGPVNGLGQTGGEIVAITIRTADPKLLQALVRIAIGGRGAFPSGNAVTFILSALTGR